MITPTIILRQWKDSDLEPFAEMNADPEVMRYFVRTRSAEESKADLARFRNLIEARGWGLWAVEVDDVCAGFTGLSVPNFAAPFMPSVEIGWRLRREFWGRGIAYTAARQAEKYAFENLKLSALVSFTTAGNQRSRKLMERLDFSHDAKEDFLHPQLEENHPLRPHVLYRKSRVEFAQ